MIGRDNADRAMHVQLYDWLPAGQFQLSAGLLIDQLSMSFVMLITFVGSLILVYSLGYMAHDKDKRRLLRVHEPLRGGDHARPRRLYLASTSGGRASASRPTC